MERAKVETKKESAVAANQQSSRSAKGHKIAGWLLGTIVAASIGWVCLFTTLSTHSDVNRDHVYEAFETKYFPEKAGARVFTYIGVFYLWLGTLTYAFLHAGFRLPKPTYHLVRQYRVPLLHCNVSMLELLAVAFYVSVQIATVLARVFQRFELPWWPTERVWYEVSKCFGKLLAFTILIILFPISKNCFWWDLFNFQFERAVKLHRWVAWSMVWLVAIHAVTAIVPLVMTGEFKHCMLSNEDCQKPGGWGTYQGLRTSKVYQYGWIALVFYVPLVITALPWFRRNKFEWFYYTHFLFIPFFVVIHLHYNDMIYYSAPGLSAYILDKMVWFVASRRRTKLVKLEVPATGFVRITIALDEGHSYLPGQWVLIKIPAVSIWEWHPMTVASSSGHSTITIDIKVLGNWTEKLMQLATRFDPLKVVHTSIFVDSFHGSSHQQAQGFLNHKAVVMFSGGIGVTPMMSALRTLVEQSHTKYTDIRKVVFVWCVKKKSVLELYRNELAKYQSFDRLLSGCELQVLVHCTFSEDEDEDSDNDVALQIESSTDDDAELDHVNHGPFMQCVFGYKHQLALTLSTGCGFLLGVLFANMAAYESGWKKEAESFLRLFLGIFCAAYCAFVSLSCSFFRPTPDWSEKDQTDPKEKSSNAFSDSNELFVVEGCRPNVSQILANMDSYAKANGISSVGVAVCGPDNLVDAVFSSCRRHSSSTVQFLVDEETFEW